MTETWTCEFCATTYHSSKNYERCECVGMSAFRAGRSVPYSLSEQKSAEAEAALRGMSFIVDGKHVSADRVFILSVPDTIGPISNMRAAKADAQRVMAELEAFQLNVSKPMNKAHVEMTGQHLSQIMDVLLLEKKSHWDNTYLGMHSYITMVDIEDKCRALMSEMNALIAVNNDLREIVRAPRADPTVTPAPKAGTMVDGATRVDNSNCKFAQGGAPCSLWCGDSHCRPALRDGVIINGILVTDPELSEAISERAPGESRACGICGKLFGFDSMFCDEHR